MQHDTVAGNTKMQEMSLNVLMGDQARSRSTFKVNACAVSLLNPKLPNSFQGEAKKCISEMPLVGEVDKQ